jgi:hypothetical protein
VIQLRATWHLPAGGSVDRATALLLAEHVPAVRSLPGLARHELLTALRANDRSHPSWWRGELLLFEDDDSFLGAQTSAGWAAAWTGQLRDEVAGLWREAYDVEEEFVPQCAPQIAQGPVTALSGTWQVPPYLTPADVDPHYLAVHVPNVRRLPNLLRHTTFRTRNWPDGRHADTWRSAEIRFADEAAFRAVHASPEYQHLREDGFNVSVAAHHVSIYSIDDTWTRQH